MAYTLYTKDNCLYNVKVPYIFCGFSLIRKKLNNEIITLT